MINEQTIEKATYLPLEGVAGAELKLEHFLKQGSQLVRQTEPGTPLWFGLKENNSYAIFDLFYQESDRQQHFKGQVAKALQLNAPDLIKGGWETGVVHNVNNFDIIASNQFIKEQVLKSKLANLITFKAKPGKEPELEDFLLAAAKNVDANEEQTHLWLALKTGPSSFAIFDSFAHSEAQQSHFSGMVAQQLQKHAPELIVDGWEDGVLAHVHFFDIIALS
ncbi:hypothetical protein [Legionella sp. km772]|uniref:hypothetical protein n=1 Tax=Legionella sp. km772 TaxID=2498111 RepID=UPI000F8E3A2F|nr:hypothetical protein [Legionella sp. km772]RUR13181.1 hypothetical protein ELY15_02935 [Legionella sp. km772]